MQCNEYNIIGYPSDLTQFPLWPDVEMPESQQPAQDQDVQEEVSTPAQDEPLATQLYLPGFEPK